MKKTSITGRPKALLLFAIVALCVTALFACNVAVPLPASPIAVTPNVPEEGTPVIPDGVDRTPNVMSSVQGIPQPTSVPIISVVLADGDLRLDQVTRENWVRSSVTIFGTDGGVILDGVGSQFKGRGNSSWSFPQKGYRFKLDAKCGLFGNAPSKHWEIIAAANDPTYLINYLAYSTVNEVLGYIEYTTSANFVEVYVNGDYHGLYLLCEKVRVDTGRVDIASEFGVLDTGYLIEYDNYARANGAVLGIDYFRTGRESYDEWGFTVKSPDPDDYRNEAFYQLQVSFIQSYLISVFEALEAFDWALVNRLIDVNSFVDMCIIRECFMNIDNGSFYLYKKPNNGKLYAGPAWDFDLSATGCQYELDLYDETSLTVLFNPFFSLLLQFEEFNELVKTRWATKSAELEATIIRLVDAVEPLADVFLKSATRWDMPDILARQQELKEWLLNRMSFVFNYLA